MPRQIIIDIDTEANVTVAVEGVAGVGCKQLSEAIERAIGSTTDDKLTDDFHRHEEQTHHGEQSETTHY